MYSVLSYGRMAADGVRIDAYARAIAGAVRPGHVVADLGCGSGILSLLALRAGARRVHAVDLNPAVWLARDLAIENGYGDKLVVHHANTFDVELPERADVIVADMRGSCPLYEHNLAAMEDARTRLLAPGGALIPSRDRLFAALVDTESHRRDLETGFSGIERQGFRATAARVATLNAAHSDTELPILMSHVVSEAKPWAEVRYGEPFARSFSGDLELAIVRGGIVHAIALWFEATLWGDVGFSTSPGHHMVYKRTVLPLLEPVRVSAGETALVTVRTDARGDQWAWETQIGSGPRVRQASFLGMPTSPDALLRESLDAKPALSAFGERARGVLSGIDGRTTVQELAAAAAAASPSRRPESVLDEVKACVRRYAR